MILSNDDNNNLNVVIESLKDDDPEKRKESAEKLGESCSVDAVEPLIESLTDDNQ